MTHNPLATKLRVLRAERALTLEKAAERAGITPETLSYLEHGKRDPYLPTLRKLAAGYGVPVSVLLEAQGAGEPELAGKAEAPQDTGPPQIELEQLQDAHIHSGSRELEDVNNALAAIWHGDKEAGYSCMVLGYVLAHPDEFFPEATVYALDMALEKVLLP